MKNMFMNNMNNKIVLDDKITDFLRKWPLTWTNSDILMKKGCML